MVGWWSGELTTGVLAAVAVVPAAAIPMWVSRALFLVVVEHAAFGWAVAAVALWHVVPAQSTANKMGVKNLFITDAGFETCFVPSTFGARAQNTSLIKIFGTHHIEKRVRYDDARALLFGVKLEEETREGRVVELFTDTAEPVQGFHQVTVHHGTRVWVQLAVQLGLGCYKADRVNNVTRQTGSIIITVQLRATKQFTAQYFLPLTSYDTS